jgi:CO/xanthine dehydrogenase FAD-binding subunit
VAAGVTSPLPPYLRPDRLEDALAILATEPARLVVAGGTDVYPAHASRPIDRPVLDITALPGLREVTADAEGWRIPALTTWTDVAQAELPPELDALRAAARTIGGRQIQNTGTLCGNVVNASPASDGLPNLLALDASVEVASADGERIVSIADFVRGSRQTDLRTGELVTGLRIPRVTGGDAGTAGEARSTFLKLGSRAYLVISIVAVAAVLVVDGGVVVDARVAVGACSPVARRLRGLERELRGRRAGPSLATVPAMEHLSPLAPIDDIRGTADYRWDAALTLVRRAIAEVAG